MNNINNIRQVQSLLKLPVSAAALMGTYVQIFSDKELIGNLPISMTPGDIIVYDTEVSLLHRLNWAKVYNKHLKALTSLIVDNLKRSDFELTAATFRKIYVKDHSKKLIGYFECLFEDDHWRIESINIDATN
jgi:hypothetical protein